MDIVSRLKRFMNSLDLTSSQFADTCRIPRPSLSQLLNGRNKKVSDEIITKIHESFPNLSIVWLMFGEGEMETVSNIQFSEPQNSQNSPFNQSQSTDNQPFTDAFSVREIGTNFSSEKFTTGSTATFSNETPVSTVTTPSGQPQQQSAAPHAPHTAIKLNPSSNKRITNIVVFYDDNSFESFSPSL